MHISPKVITTNSVDFGAFGAFRWENVFQLSFVLINADLPWTYIKVISLAGLFLERHMGEHQKKIDGF